MPLFRFILSILHVDAIFHVFERVADKASSFRESKAEEKTKSVENICGIGR